MRSCRILFLALQTLYKDTRVYKDIISTIRLLLELKNAWLLHPTVNKALHAERDRNEVTRPYPHTGRCLSSSLSWSVGFPIKGVLLAYYLVLKYVSEWSKENGLNLNPNKCVQCMFSLKENAVTDPGLKVTISAVESVTYFWGYIREKSKLDGIFRNCVHLFFFAKKLRRLSTPAEFIRKFGESGVIPIILYCSPIIFPGLLKQYFALQ